MSNNMGNISGKPYSPPRAGQSPQQGTGRQVTTPLTAVTTGPPGGIRRTSTPNTIRSYLNRNGYVLAEILGEGSYSKVKACTRYSTLDGSYMYKVACKIIDKCRASDDFVTKFLPRELQTVRELNHPNIVRVWDIVSLQDFVYIFMDFCDGGDLLEYVKAKGLISESRSRHYFRQLVSAVRYLHNLDIAHRDLKCENILMTGQDQIKISDFGFARYCHNAEGKRILSDTYCGSAAYAAPEILQGTSYNPKLYDCWSIGCVLFIMVTGHMPFDESDIQTMLKNQLERRLTFPNAVEEQLSIAAKILIRRLLEPDVTKRGNIEVAGSHEWTRLHLGFRPATGSLSSSPDGDSDMLTSPESSPRTLGENAMEHPCRYIDFRRPQGSRPESPALGNLDYNAEVSLDERRRHIGSRGAGVPEGGPPSRLPRTGTALPGSSQSGGGTGHGSQNKFTVGRRR